MSGDAFKKYFWIPYAVGLLIFMGWYFRGTFRQDTEKTAIDRTIDKYERVLEVRPEVKTMVALAGAYMQKVRESADVSYYAKVDSLMDEAGKLEPENPEIDALRTLLALGRHDFKKALTLTDKIITKNPNRSLYYGLRGDAQIELGLYKEVATSYQKMVDLRPDFSSLSRIAYLRELNGDIEGAKEAARQALEAGASFAENIAWGYVELGKLFLRNDLEQARSHFQRALSVQKNYTPALEGLGKVAFARGENQEAIQYFTQALELLPVAQYAIDLGDVYLSGGDSARAAQQYYLAQVAFDKSEKSGVNTDLERSLFLSERDLDISVALEKGKAAYRLRPSIYGADAYAWALYKNNRIADAAEKIKEALRLGEYDALILYHAGVIAEARGEKSQARYFLEKALFLDPNFSLLGPTHIRLVLEKL